MKRRIVSIFIIYIFLSLIFLSCQKRETVPARDKTIKVVTTLFPLYDFAKNVGGKRVQVELLVPPGMEPHSFEPKPGDIRKIRDADVSIYAGNFMDPWIEDVHKGVPNKNLLVINTSMGIELAEDRDLTEHHRHDRNSEDERGHHHGQNGKDPHIWLDFSNAQTMVENILNGFITLDPANRDEYLKNAEAYSAQLSRLDQQFHDALTSCKKDMIIHGGHFAFEPRGRAVPRPRGKNRSRRPEALCGGGLRS